MAIDIYMDHHIPRAITEGLRLRQVNVITAWEDGTHSYDDSELLTRASELNRALFSQDDDLLIEAVMRQKNGISFNGVIYAHQLNISIGKCVQDLELIAKTCMQEDLMNQIQFLPL